MKFLIYGAGVIGSIFSGKLAKAGHNVNILARGKRAEEIRQNGIILTSPGNKHSEVTPVTVIDELAPDDIYDYIFVVLQRTQVDSVLPIISRNRSKNIVFVVNTALGYEGWAEAVGRERLLLAFPSAGGERIDGKVVYFIGRKAIRIFQTTTFGEYTGQKTDRILNLIKVFNSVGIPSVYCRDMNSWQKTHVALVTSIANALYKYECDNYRLAKSYTSVKLMIKGIKEGFSVLNKLGYKTTPSKLMYFKLPAWLLASVFKVVLGTKMAEITMAKHCIAAKPELSYLQSEFDTLITQSGLQTPAIDKLRELN